MTKWIAGIQFEGEKKAFEGFTVEVLKVRELVLAGFV
jgi:hypothetical protein